MTKEQEKWIAKFLGENPKLKSKVEKDMAEIETIDGARVESNKERDKLKAKMAALVGKEPVDLVALRKLADAEFKRAGDLDKLLKAATEKNLPIAPSPAKVSFADNDSEGASEWSEKVCMAAFLKYSWFDFKDLRKSGEEVDVPGTKKQKKITDDVMWKLYQFRRHYVDALIAKLHDRYKESGLLFKSGGSEDIESDLDITVASPGNGDDVKAMKDFNEAVKADFHRPPGRVFDTNLYARDYRAITDNLSKERPANPKEDADIAEPEGEMARISGIDQDVATLMKQRRFLDDQTYTAMWEGLRDSIVDPVEKKHIQQRFEEAEDAYLLTAMEKALAIADKVKAALAKAPKAKREAFEKEWSIFEDARKSDSFPVVLRQLPKLLDLMEEEFPDEVMEVTDAQYADRMVILRADQMKIADLEKQLKEHTGSDAAACEGLHKGKTHAEWLKATSDGVNSLKANVKKAQFTNIVFANEAYVSQGAITHIVAGSQASTPEKKKEVLEKIKPAELLQSTNEQMADFFKDMKHMEHAEKAAKTPTEKRRASGEAFVHASKYLSRMLDAAAMLQEKYSEKGSEAVLKQLTEPAFDLCERAKVGSPRELQKKVDDLLVRLRKSSTIPGDAKAELAMAEVEKVFGVEDIDWFRKLITGFCVDFNARVRALDEFKEAQKVAIETERQYFRPAQ